VEKDFETVVLLDMYAGLLTEKQRRLCDMYYNQDYSLAEIAELENTTRQAVRDSIEKAREKLHDTEQRLGLSQKRMSTLRALSRAMEAAQGNEALTDILEEISGLWESENGV
jgi:predicted DNA-binding protein YlxM (UPF0122 family)